MKKLSVILSVLSVVFLITGCSSQTSPNHNQSSSSTAQQSSSSQADSGQSTSSASNSSSSQANSSSVPNVTTGSTGQVLKDVRSILKNGSELLLPSTLPVEKGKYASAVVKNGSSGNTVSFKQTSQPVKVNDASLTTAQTVATVKSTTYASTSEAAKQISFHKYGKSDGSPVTLGHNITGYADAGAGTAGTSWNEGRWTLMALSPTSDAQKGIALAKKVVSYLEIHSLPAPHQYGLIQVYTDSRQDYIMWQEGKTVYQLTDVNDPLKLLSVAVSMR